MPEVVKPVKIGVMHRVRYSATRSTARMAELEDQSLTEIRKHGEQIEGLTSFAMRDDDDADYLRILFSCWIIPYEKKDVTP